MFRLVLFFLCLSPLLAFAQNLYPKIASPSQEASMIQENTNLSESVADGTLIINETRDILKSIDPGRNFSNVDVLPYAEYEKQKYFMFNDEVDFSSLEIKENFLRNLPDGIIPVVYTQNWSPEYINILRDNLSSFLRDPTILEVVYFDGEGSSFWSRDSIPVPILIREGSYTDLAVVDAKYYHFYEPDEQVADYFRAYRLSHDYYFEGGNFLATKQGVCAVVNVDSVRIIPDVLFENFYGCKKLIRFPHIKGIGHMDESLKFIDDRTALTDVQEYKVILEQNGFNAILFPRALQEYETYLNSVILQDVVYVPVFDRAEDEDAIAAYRNLGFQVVPMNSYYLSNDGLGSLHCISMVYPDLSQF